jgi:hypothetical protein
MHPKKVLIPATLGLLMIVGVAFFALGLQRPFFGREQAVRATHDGDRIVAAVLGFRAKHGRPPVSNGELVPEFLPGQPSSAFGEWAIWLDPDRGFGHYDIAVGLRPDHRKIRSHYEYIACYIRLGSQRIDWVGSARTWYDEGGTLRRREPG